MADNRIYDMINVFKYSPAREAARLVGCDADFRNRYRALANDVVEELWRLYRAGEIGFAKLTWTNQFVLWGEAERRPGFDVRINDKVEPTASSSNYASAPEQSRLAAASLIMVHEAVHLVRDIPNYVEEEMVCRTLELLYYKDLHLGRTYASRVTGTRCTARIRPEPREVGHLRNLHEEQVSYYDCAQLVDFVLTDTNEYRPSLTSDFINRSLEWWGGINNRHFQVRGYYLRVLADDPTRQPEPILKILESIPTEADWVDVKRTAGPLSRIRQALDRGRGLGTGQLPGATMAGRLNGLLPAIAREVSP